MSRKTVLIYIMQTEMSWLPLYSVCYHFQILLEWLLKNVFIRGYLNTNEAFFMSICHSSFHIDHSCSFVFILILSTSSLLNMHLWPHLLQLLFFCYSYQKDFVCLFAFSTKFFQSCVCVCVWFLPLFTFGKCFPIWRSAKSPRIFVFHCFFFPFYVTLYFFPNPALFFCVSWLCLKISIWHP